MKKIFGEGQVSPWSFYKNDYFDKQITILEEQQIQRRQIKIKSNSNVQLSRKKAIDKKQQMKQKLAILEKQGSPSQRIISKLMNEQGQSDKILSRHRMAKSFQPKFCSKSNREKQQRKAMEKYTSIVSTPANFVELMKQSEHLRYQTIIVKILREQLKIQTNKQTEIDRIENYEFLLPILGKKKAPQLPFIIRQKSPNSKKRPSLDEANYQGQKIIDGIMSRNLKENDRSYRQYLLKLLNSQPH